MTVPLQEARNSLLERATAYVRSRLHGPAAQNAETLLRTYWERVPPEDLVGRDPVDLAGAALAHLHFAERRPPGVARVRVYTPNFDDHGWASTHSVVEVVVDDMPFLLDSVSMELVRQGCGLHVVVHPVVPVTRDGDGHLTAVGTGPAEAFIHIEIDRQPDGERFEALRAGIAAVLDDVRAAVEDWPAMKARAERLAAELQEKPPPGDARDIAEARDYLRFLADDHFVFLGYREYDLDRHGDEEHLRPVSGSGLGILRDDPAAEPAAPSRSFARVPAELRRQSPDSDPLILTKAATRATVHRPTALDYVGLKRYGADGTVAGERRFLGLYTSTMHKAPTADIPVLRRTVAAVLDRAGFAPASHDAKALAEVIESLPRMELLEVTADELFDEALGILALQERQRVRLFARRDRFGRHWSCLVFVPLDRYTQAVRQRITDILLGAFGGTGFEYSAQVGESVLARLHFVVHTDPAAAAGAAPDLEVVESRIAQATRSWSDDLSEALLEGYGEERGLALLRRYGNAFPAAYRADFPARAAVADIARIESCEGGGGIALSLAQPLEADGLLRFKLFAAGRPLPLSDVLPLLENMGVRVIDQRPYEVRTPDDAVVWIHDFGLRPEEVDFEAEGVKGIFTEAFAASWRGEQENDGFNRLVLAAGLTGREVAVLRAYSKYLRQVGSAFSQPYMERALVANAHISRLLVELFHARFDPARLPDPDDEASVLTKRLEESIDAVASLDEDRILRSFLALVQATLRTNWFQPYRPGHPVAFKLDPAQVPDLPLPRPRYEIFVCSPRVEGVHLRGGRVSRGGLRWSDRREDFRTEVLGLMKAQMVKNAVIVPVGAKGGFVMKRPPAAPPGGTPDRDAVAAEVAACYRDFVSGLLDLTDNIVGGEVVHPPAVHSYDGDDPYLVVAADKGTATFSDLANSIAAEYGFWLGDAFASGGSSGYDHKKMGITAKGAWESVKRHFRDFGIDADTAPITVAGIGDMSGDVFGNGMLCSRNLKLVAAFDHRHVFLDPDPDPVRSAAERERLFNLPRSSWADYDPAAISPGGGVFPRTAKSIPLSPEVRAALAVDAETLRPADLIRAVLRAPVDLLWNGGIGTYVKAATETHADVGDKANDAVRVDAAELRARVVGEGGNLGFTQRGRIEFALAGGRINTDAIDNSAGVDCSDHEVNIKILLDTVVADGEMTTLQRNRLLAEMTGEVAAMVLRDNYDQTGALATARAQAAPMVDVHARYLRKLESEGGLDRAVEFLPTDEVLAQRRSAGMGLTSPEFAVLLAYTKLDVVSRLLASDACEDPWFERELTAYFPEPLRDGRFAAALVRHPLRREIIATRVTNLLVDRAGTSFVHRLTEETGAAVPELARAHAAAWEIFRLEELWGAVEALDNIVPAATQIEMMLPIRRLAERAGRWLVRHGPRPLDVAAAVGAFGEGATRLAGLLPALLSPPDRDAADARAGAWVEAGAGKDLAARVAALDALAPALDVVQVAGGADGVAGVAAVYFALGTALELDWLRDRIAALPRDDRWQALARAALGDDYARERAALTAEVLAGGGFEPWMAGHRAAVDRFLAVVDDIRAGAPPDLATLSVAMREARALSTGG
ncbi:MAG TPA: NAD-glutamate dehydrogenase [Acidimicrobiia bacterium]|nr:NAD-glutamate dehydrogenase [Acidimicrobiia bacterium]